MALFLRSSHYHGLPFSQPFLPMLPVVMSLNSGQALRPIVTRRNRQAPKGGLLQQLLPRQPTQVFTKEPDVPTLAYSLVAAGPLATGEACIASSGRGNGVSIGEGET